jgi:hypothetical protein
MLVDELLQTHKDIERGVELQPVLQGSRRAFPGPDDVPGCLDGLGLPGEAITSAVRSHDPFQKIVGVWLIRRLSPDSNPIEISHLPEAREEGTLLHAMGSEAANVHVGRKGQSKKILKDLNRRKRKWLRSAAKEMPKAMQREWRDYKSS